MKLKPNIDTVTFLKAVAKCHGEVYFISEENDQLNLKSLLSAYIFLATSQGKHWLEKGHIRLIDPSDLQYLQTYLADS